MSTDDQFALFEGVYAARRTWSRPKSGRYWMQLRTDVLIDDGQSHLGLMEQRNL
jgi:hypothetical protein